jgi:hypothetical protein
VPGKAFSCLSNRQQRRSAYTVAAPKMSGKLYSIERAISSPGSRFSFYTDAICAPSGSVVRSDISLGKQAVTCTDKHEFTRRRIVAHLEQVLNFRVTQKCFCLFAFWKGVSACVRFASYRALRLGLRRGDLRHDPSQVLEDRRLGSCRPPHQGCHGLGLPDRSGVRARCRPGQSASGFRRPLPNPGGLHHR